MKDYASYSFWLGTSGDDLRPRGRLEGSEEADVAILGAGFSGLWTAYYLLRAEPSLRVTILERDIAGFGASGRNGGWCTANFPVTPNELCRRFGTRRTQDLVTAMRDTVDEVGGICQAEDIDAQFHKGGVLRLARGNQQMPAIEAAYGAYQNLGLAEGMRLLNEEQTAERIRVAGTVGALFSPHAATVHPGRLVRGLARAVERRGAKLREQSEVTGVVNGRPATLRTCQGEVRADVVVLAGEAYLSSLPGFRRRVMPLYSLIGLTPPLSQEQWRTIGWGHRECVSSMRYTVDYLQRTIDGRILFGSRGEPYHLASTIQDRFDRHAPMHRSIEGLLHDWFPNLRAMDFTHTWGGPVGMPRDWMPNVSFDSKSGVAVAFGYTGQGVAISNLAGRALADLVLGKSSAITSLPLVGHRSRRWEPEPLRWLGARYVQRAYARVDAKAERTGEPPTGRSLAERLGRH